MAQLVSLDDTIAFPAFHDCPSDNDVDLRYYVNKNGIYGPKRHWCLLAEIEEAFTFFRLRLELRDKTGTRFPLTFYLENGDVDSREYVEGRTVAVLYAEQHNFLDMNVGVRQESCKTISVLPGSLDKINSLEAIATKAYDESTKHNLCQSCKTKSDDLKRCASCKLFYYCSKDCQKKAWTLQGHKEDCKILKKLGAILRVDWNEFANFKAFPLE